MSQGHKVIYKTALSSDRKSDGKFRETGVCKVLCLKKSMYFKQGYQTSGSETKLLEGYEYCPFCGERFIGELDFGKDG